MSSANEKKATVVLDGRYVGAYRKTMCRHLKQILNRAITEKKSGKGLFTRPEVDPGLFYLLQALEELEPGVGWRHKAIVTAVHSIDIAIKMKDKWWWPRYEEAIRKHQFGMTSGGFDLCYEWLDQYLHKTCVESAAIRFQLSEQIAKRYLRAKKAVWEPVDIPPLPANFPEPLWKNDHVSELPQRGNEGINKYGRLIAIKILSIFEKPIWEIHYGAMYLGDFSRQEKPKAWGDLTQAFLGNSVVGCNDFHLFSGIPILQRSFGGSPDSVLESVATFSGIMNHYMNWENAPESFYVMMGALLVNDQKTLNHWAKRITTNAGSRNYSKFFKSMNNMLYRLVTDPDDTSIPACSTVPGKFWSAHQQAFIGLLTRDTRLFNESIDVMLRQWLKVDDYIWSGSIKFYCSIPAIALQRTALRLGMQINIPAHLCNDPELVLAKDPEKANSVWAVFPGADLVANEADLFWPSLYLNEKVTGVLEREGQNLHINPSQEMISDPTTGKINLKLKVKIPAGIATNLSLTEDIAVAGGSRNSSYNISKCSFRAYFRNLWEDKWILEIDSNPVSTAIEGDTVIATTNNTIYALDIANGKIKWKKRLNGESYDFHPIITGELVIMHTNKCICAYYIKNGKTKWIFEGATTNPVINEKEMRLCFGVQTTQGAMLAMDALTGEKVWEKEIGHGKIYTLCLANDRLYAAQYRDRLYQLDPDNGHVENISKERVGSNVLIKDNIAYSVLLCDDADLQTIGAFELFTNEIKWLCDPEQLDDELHYSGRLWMIRNSRVYSECLDFHALDLNSGQVIWSINDTTQHGYKPVANEHNDIYLAHDRDLLIIHEDTI